MSELIGGLYEEFDGEYVSFCPACGDPIDYCQGHGEYGDPLGFRILDNHDAGYHMDCHERGCTAAGTSAIGSGEGGW